MNYIPAQAFPLNVIFWCLPIDGSIFILSNINDQYFFKRSILKNYEGPHDIHFLLS